MENCRICGQVGDGQPFDNWVRDTFTNFDHLYPGEIVCAECLFWFEQKSVELQTRMGKEKPQKMQNYSHFVVGGEWTPIGKGDKRRMAALLLDGVFPEMAVIAVSGQKHLAFRARRNPANGRNGWVQFEEQAVWVEQDGLRKLLDTVESLYQGFSKEEIESGRYSPHRVMTFGIERWQRLEKQIKPIRQTGLFGLALFLAQRSEDGRQDDGDNVIAGDLAGDIARLQEPLQDDDLGAVRKRDPGGGLHEQPGEVRQLDLFAAEG